MNFLSEVREASNDLTKEGSETGGLVFGLMDGKTEDEREIGRRLRAFDRKLVKLIADFREREFPGNPGVAEYRDLFVEYLEWQRVEAPAAIERALAIARTEGQSIEAREDRLYADAEVLGRQEVEWGRRLEVTSNELYRKLAAGD